MVKKYRKRNSSYSGGGLIRRTLTVAVSFFFGFLTASYVDIGQISAWLDSHGPDRSALVSTPQLAHQTKPKLEFYTLLTANHNESIMAPPLPTPAPAVAPSAPAVTKPTVVAAVSKPAVVRAPVTASRPAMPEPPKPAKATPPIVPTVAATKGTYTIQVAAFKAREDAERMKANLVLKGFSVSVSGISAQRVIWYRVMVGPFNSREQAYKTQIVLAQRERMNGMIRKMDA